MMFGIPNYTPQFYQNSDSFIKAHRNSLIGLIGKSIDEYWLMWETKDNEWFNDGPIILKIGKQQFEFQAIKLDEFSLTIDQIDLTQRLDWFGGSDEFQLDWKTKCHADIDKIIGLPIKEIGILAFKMITTVIEDKSNPRNIGTIDEGDFLLNGIQFEFKDNRRRKYLQIFNALDQNGLTSKPFKEDYQNKKISLTDAKNGY